MSRNVAGKHQRNLWKMALGLCALLTMALGAAEPVGATIDYTLSVAQPDQHVFRVTMTVPNVQGELVVQLPAWNALYQIRDFAHHVFAVQATDEAQRPLRISKLDKQTWRLRAQGSVSVRYSTYWDEPGAFSAQLNSEHAFLNLATVLFYVPDRRGEEARLQFRDLPAAWRVALALPREASGAAGQTVAYRAASYDALVDAPVELGSFDELHVAAGGRPIRIVVHGSGWDREQVAEVVRRIADYEIRLMGGAPFEEYVFIYHIGPGAMGAGGGMEHANSTAIFASSGARLAPISAHEFFHLWNVKRIRPRSLEPVDYTREQWTRALWFAEGVTNTYASYTLLRTGLWERKQFYEDLADQMTELESRPARRWKSVEEASLDAWLEKYALYRRPELSISYYNKGQLLGVLLDILLRDVSDNRVGLDQLLRALNKNFAERGHFYDDSADLLAEAQTLARAAQPNGADKALAEFFERYVAGTDEVLWSDFLGRAGLAVKDRGQTFADFGFLAVRTMDGPVVTKVLAGSAAERAGLAEGDVLVELNGAPFPRQPSRWLREHRPGEVVRLRFRREIAEREVSFALGERAGRTLEVQEMAAPSPKQRRILEGILSGQTDSPSR